MKFEAARNFRTGRNGPIQVIIIHTVETPGRPGAAQAVADYYSGANAPIASMHYVVGDEVIQTVPDADTAWAAPPLNDAGLQIEHVGYAKQTTADWAAPYFAAELIRSVALTAGLAKVHNIAPKKLTVPEVARIISGDTSVTGFCGHVDVNAAMTFLHKQPQSTHWDPGPGFPWDSYMRSVVAILAPAVTEPTGVPLVATQAEIQGIADASALAILRFPIHHVGKPDVPFLQAFADLATDVAALRVELDAIKAKVGA